MEAAHVAQKNNLNRMYPPPHVQESVMGAAHVAQKKNYVWIPTKSKARDIADRVQDTYI